VGPPGRLLTVLCHRGWQCVAPAATGEFCLSGFAVGCEPFEWPPPFPARLTPSAYPFILTSLCWKFPDAGSVISTGAARESPLVTFWKYPETTRSDTESFTVPGPSSGQALAGNPTLEVEVYLRDAYRADPIVKLARLDP